MASSNLATARKSIAPAHRRIGALLMESGKLGEQDLQRVSEYQRRHGVRFGEAAVALGLTSEAEVQSALARQFNYPVARRGESALSPMLVSAYQPFDAGAEAIRVLRSELTLRWFDRGHRALAITSARSGTGSSTLAANLAVSFAQLGEHTLLIDANFRHPAQHWLFGLLADAGLAEVLVGRGSLEETCLSIPALEGLAVLCAGPVPPNPHELLSGRPLRQLLEQAQQRFSVIIMDTPAALQYADAQIIGARAGGYLLVSRRHQTRVADARATMARFAPTGAVPLGAVVID